MSTGIQFHRYIFLVPEINIFDWYTKEKKGRFGFSMRVLFDFGFCVPIVLFFRRYRLVMRIRQKSNDLFDNSMRKNI